MGLPACGRCILKGQEALFEALPDFLELLDLVRYRLIRRKLLVRLYESCLCMLSAPRHLAGNVTKHVDSCGRDSQLREAVRPCSLAVASCSASMLVHEEKAMLDSPCFAASSQDKGDETLEVRPSCRFLQRFGSMHSYTTLSSRMLHY